jgi:hypothetical protein
MTTIGNLSIGQAPSYEDYESLKKWLHNQYPSVYSQINLHRFTFNQAGTAGAVDISQAGGLTISAKTSTALTIVLASDTNDNAYDTHSVTGYYITNAGVKSSFTASYDTDDTTTTISTGAAILRLLHGLL